MGRLACQGAILVCELSAAEPGRAGDVFIYLFDFPITKCRRDGDISMICDADFTIHDAKEGIAGNKSQVERILGWSSYG